MIKKITNYLLLISLIFLLISCGHTEESKEEPDIIPDDPTESPGDTPDIPDDPNDQDPSIENVEFSVSLVYNQKIFIPEEEIKVVWADEYAQYTQIIDKTGYAKKNLDGDFNVYLTNLPSGYTYNPNIYTASTDQPTVEIELFKVARLRSGTGAENSMYEIKTEGAYRATIKRKDHHVFFEFHPSVAGTYVIEGMVNIYENVINPKIDTYNGTFAYKTKDKTIDSGGAYLKGGYTKNFKWVINVTDDRIGNIYMFAVFVESLTGTYPVDVDFTLTRADDYYEDGIVSKLMKAESPFFKTDEFLEADYIFKNADGGIGSYYNSITNGTGILDGSKFKYNEETGYWHVYDEQTNTFGPILCAYITTPCAFYEESLNKIESHGNKNLTVSNGTENYKYFIEQEYAARCNSDGVCYVTNELMEFLQKFSVSQRLFFDGNGFVETTGVFALEKDQWLFACGYYEEK